MFRPSGAPEEPHGNEADAALRRGLSRLPVPDVASDFDARIHAALRRPTPWWRLLWTQARPVLSTAACSLLVTLSQFFGSPIQCIVEGVPGGESELVVHCDSMLFLIPLPSQTNVRPHNRQES